jgi:adenylate cyclase
MAPVMKILGSSPSSYNPNLCSRCEDLVLKHEGGTEVELTMLFADVRGSTPLSLTTSPRKYSQLIGNFYKTTTGILVKHNAMVNRLMGDQVIGLFVPHLAGENHTKEAIQAGQEIQFADFSKTENDLGLPLGIGIHLGTAYVGSVGSNSSVNEIAVLGDAANLAARLSSAANPGEILISAVAADAAKIKGKGWSKRKVELKGFREPLTVHAI